MFSQEHLTIDLKTEDPKVNEALVALLNKTSSDPHHRYHRDELLLKVEGYEKAIEILIHEKILRDAHPSEFDLTSEGAKILRFVPSGYPIQRMISEPRDGLAVYIGRGDVFTLSQMRTLERRFFVRQSESGAPVFEVNEGIGIHTGFRLAAMEARVQKMNWQLTQK